MGAAQGHVKDFDVAYELAVQGPDGRPTGEVETISRERRFAKATLRFKIGGEEFRRVPAVAPEKLERWMAMVGLDMVATEKETVEIFDATVIAFLEPGQEELWRHVRREDAPEPLNLNDIKGLIRWLVTEDAGRPTGQPSGSSSGPGGRPIGMSSTVASPSPEGPE